MSLRLLYFDYSFSASQSNVRLWRLKTVPALKGLNNSVVDCNVFIDVSDTQWRIREGGGGRGPTQSHMTRCFGGKFQMTPSSVSWLTNCWLRFTSSGTCVALDGAPVWHFVGLWPATLSASVAPGLRNVLWFCTRSICFSNRLTAYKIERHFCGLSYLNMSGNNQVENIFLESVTFHARMLSSKVAQSLKSYRHLSDLSNLLTSIHNRLWRINTGSSLDVRCWCLKTVL